MLDCLLESTPAGDVQDAGYEIELESLAASRNVEQVSS